MSKLNKPAKNLAWLLLLPLVIGAITFAQNAAHKVNSIPEKQIVSIKPGPTAKLKNKKPEGGKPTAASIDQKTEEKKPLNKTVKTQTPTKKEAPKQNTEPKKQATSKPYPKGKKENPKIIPAKIKVALNIDKGSGSKSYLVEIKPESTVLVVLKTAGSKYGFSLRYSNYSYGAFIEEIDGVANDPANSMYWLYYINGKLANMGASSQKIKEGDDILWKYEKTDS